LVHLDGIGLFLKMGVLYQLVNQEKKMKYYVPTEMEPIEAAVKSNMTSVCTAEISEIHRNANNAFKD